jgi:hypothetical protein
MRQPPRGAQAAEELPVAKAEITFSTCSDPHCGQLAPSPASDLTNFSNFVWHLAQKYSKIGIVLSFTGVFTVSAPAPPKAQVRRNVRATAMMIVQTIATVAMRAAISPPPC